MKKNNKNGKWIFLIVVSVIYLSTYFLFQDKFGLISSMFLDLVIKIIPIFIVVFLLMVLINYFIDNKMIKKTMTDKSSHKLWLISIVSGIISMGPIYLWYPIMKELLDKGLKYRYVAAFLYNRGIKLQLLPMLILYFGITYSLTLMIVMAVLSIPQAIIIEKLSTKYKRS